MPTTPEASSPDARPTSAPAGSSDATAPASQTSPTTTWTRATQNIDLTTLSPQNQAIKILIGDRMTEGYTLTEIANELGQQPSWVSERLNSLRNALLLQTGLFFPLADHEYDALTESIRRHGVQSPIIIGEHIALIDGRHRYLASTDLGLEHIPAVFTQGLTPEDERELAIALNAARRQITRQQKRTLIESELMRDPARSDRMIASICGVTHPTVATVRNEIAAQQRIQTAPYQPAEPTRTAARVAVQPERRLTATGTLRTVPARPTTPRPPTDLGTITCSHGQPHTLHRHHDGTYHLTPNP